jgi:uncharacterized protein YegP (UPF0339 family)
MTIRLRLCIGPRLQSGFSFCRMQYHRVIAHGEIIAARQAYERKANAEKGIRAVKAAADAEVVDLTEEGVKK